LELDGRYFFQNGKRFWPIGFNYWPSASGVHCWKRFDPAEWREDFEAIAAHGYNTVRLFLLWEDFQPAPGGVDEKQIGNLVAVCRAASDHGLWVIPTLFQGWMSGTAFIPEWCRGKNVVRDGDVREAMVLLARKVAGALRDADNIHSIDYANEIDCICRDVDDDAVSEWTGELAQAVREERPGTIVTNGTSMGPMQAQCRWSYGAHRVDYLCMHGYPVFWQPLALGSLRSCRTTIRSGHFTSFAAAYGPVMRQEFGTAMATDGRLIGEFVRTSVMASYLAGSNGFLYWCWRDFSTSEFPYQKEPSEASLGYARADLTAKEWCFGFDEAKDWILANGDFVPAPSEVGVYVPSKFKILGQDGDAAVASAFENLVTNGICPEITAEVSDRFRLIVVPSTRLTVDEITALDGYVSGGGRVIAADLFWRTCSTYWEALTSTRNVDMLSGRRGFDLEWVGERLSIGPVDRSRLTPVMKAVNKKAEIRLVHDGFPVAIVSRRGKGTIVQFVPPLHCVESDDVAPAQTAFWRELISLSGYEAPLSVSDPRCQAGVIENGVGDRRVLVINHGTERISVRLEWLGKSWDLEIPGRSFVCRDA
jgi:hypothetical protein